MTTSVQPYASFVVSASGTAQAVLPVWERVRRTLQAPTSAGECIERAAIEVALSEQPGFEVLPLADQARVVAYVMADYDEYATGEDVTTYTRAWARGYFRS